MLLAALFFSCMLNDIEANGVNEKDPVLHEIHKRNVFGTEEQNLCRGMPLDECAKLKLKELEKCQICGLISGKDIKKEQQHANNKTTKCIPGVRMVIKGNNVCPQHRYPWMVALINEDEKICGGAIISEEFILTAAHCVALFDDEGKFERYFRPDEIKVAFLTNTPEIKPGPPTEKILRHPGFKPDKMNYDIALLKLSRKITCSKYKNPICLPDNLSNFDFQKESKLQITGWGAICAEHLTYPSKLKKADVKMVDFSECRAHAQVKATAYCLRGVNNQGPCFGDSGGSLFFQHNGKYISIGVSSMHTCEQCNGSEPFIYSSVSKAMPWIKKEVGSQEAKKEDIGQFRRLTHPE